MATMRMRESLNAALREEMERDETVFVMGEDVAVFQGAFKVTEGLLDEFGERRVRDTPISENTIVGMGVGAAMTGLRPVVEIMTVNFALLAMDMIVNHAAAIPYMFGGQVRVPMVVRMPGGGGHQLGPTHSHSFEAMFPQVPGLLVACPSTAADGKGLLKTAIRDDNPVIFIEHESLYGSRGEVPDDGDHIVDFGEAAVRREGERRDDHRRPQMAGWPSRPPPPSQRARRRGRGDRPAHAPPARPRHDPRVRAEDQPRGDRRGGMAPRRCRRQPRDADHGAGLRPSRRPRRARHRRRRSDALLGAPRAVRDAPRRACRQRRARDPRGEPLMADLVMPRLSDSMEEGTIVKWLKSVGDEVALGEELVEIETDKANMTYEADTAGTLTEIVAEEGETLPIGQVIARVGGEGSGDRTAARRGGPSQVGHPARTVAGLPMADRRRALKQLRTALSRPPPPPRRHRDHLVRPPGPTGSDGSGTRVKASPIAKRIAKDRGVELSGLSGFGPGGRIVKADVERAGGAPAAAPAAPLPTCRCWCSRRARARVRRDRQGLDRGCRALEAAADRRQADGREQGRGASLLSPGRGRHDLRGWRHAGV